MSYQWCASSFTVVGNLPVLLSWHRAMAPSRTQAPTTESSPAPENFFAKTPSTERLPLSGAETVFGQVFGRGGMSAIFKIQKTPHRAVASAAAHPDRANLARSRGTCRVKAR